MKIDALISPHFFFQKIDLTSEGSLASVFAEVIALDHLKNWSGAVKLIKYTRCSDDVSQGRDLACMN